MKDQKLFAWASLAVWILAWFALFYREIESMVVVWLESHTYNHCLFIFPASIYFIWRDRKKLCEQSISTQWYALAPLALCVVIWALGYAGGIQLFLHFSIIAIVPLSFLLVFGYQVSRAAWFPLLFVFFAVPIGEELIPVFQNITADISMVGLDIVGIPAFRDGLYISVPNGKFEVAEACSGIRFFIASVCFGVFYAYVNYQSVTRRVVFIVVAIIVPIVANGIRALGIMLVGYYSDMKHAVGADHLVYGWGFFAFIIIMLVLIGDRWKEFADDDDLQREVHPTWTELKAHKLLGLASLPLIAIFIWMSIIDSTRSAAEKESTGGLSGFVEIQKSLNPRWMPYFPGNAWEYRGVQPITKLDVYIAYYGGGEKEGELVAWNNRIYRPDFWTSAGSQRVEINVDGHHFSASTYDLRTSNNTLRMVVYWYALPGFENGSAKLAKIKQAVNILMGRSASGALIAFSVKYDRGDEEKALEQITENIQRYYDDIVKLTEIEQK